MRLAVLPFVALLATVPPSAPASGGTSLAESTIVLTGIVGRADKGTYQEQAFDVPRGVTRLDIEFTHARKGAGVELEVGLFDPERFRGTSRFSKERFHLAEHHATPSYLPGRIVPGRWRVSLSVPSIAPETHAAWQVVVRMSSASEGEGAWRQC